MTATIKKSLQEIFRLLNVKIDKIGIEEPEKNLFKINLESEDSSLLIGHHGENIQAIQHLLKSIIRQDQEEDFKLYLDIDNYRTRQEESVLNLATRKAVLARETNQPQILPPMSPYFRRLIHLHLTKEEFNDLETESIGEGEQRQVVIKIKRSEEE